MHALVTKGAEVSHSALQEENRPSGSAIESKKENRVRNHALKQSSETTVKPTGQEQ